MVRAEEKRGQGGLTQHRHQVVSGGVVTFVTSSNVTTSCHFHMPESLETNLTPALTAPAIARKPAHGKGRAVLHRSADEAIFSELSYRYPLKLLSPRTFPASDDEDGRSNQPLAIAYMLSYGGGLVSGDKIELDVHVGTGSALMILTQVRFYFTRLVCD